MAGPPQLVLSRIDDMMQVIAHRQAEISRLGGPIALLVKVRPVGTVQVMLLDKRV